MKIKSLPIGQVKTGPDDGLQEGEFIVYPSTFTREPDAYGDVIAKGAFLDSIKQWQESGDVMPGMYIHDPNQIVAESVSISEDDHGLQVKGKFLEDDHSQKVYGWLKRRLLSSLSFGYQTLEEGRVDLPNGKSANELRKVHAIEFSFLPKGFAANSDTSVVAVKALTDRLKAGNELPAKSEDQLREAISLIEGVLSSLDEPDDDDDGNDEDQDTDDEKSVKDSGNGPVLPEHDGVVQDQAKSGGHPDVALANIYMIAMEGDLS